VTAPALDPIAAELDAAWVAFRTAADAPDHKREAFERIARPLIVAAHAADASRPVAPFVHGDPRVDRWEIGQRAGLTPPPLLPPAGFEPLAAWRFVCVTDGWFMWERPLRHCEPPPAATEESALAALLTAWDSWPDERRKHPALLADITIALQRAGMADERGALTETARAIVARAAERGRR
jgi:hypothetical protein